MRVFQKRTVYIWCALMFLFVAGNAFAIEKLPIETLLPKELVIEKGFQPGNGLPIGLVQVVEGQVVIMHADLLRGYMAKKDLPIYQGDIIVTRDRGRARLAMNDGSILSLAPTTRMVITQSVYQKKKKRRFSFFKLLGKTRFWVKKLVNLRRSDVKIKTQTAVVGVRGSDFVIEGTLATTIVTAFDLEGSQLEIVSLAKPDAKPTICNSNQRSEVKKGELPTTPVFVSSAEQEQMKKDFIPIPGPGEPIEPPDFGKLGEPLKQVFFSYDDLIDYEEIITPITEKKKEEEKKKAEALARDLEFSQFIKQMEINEKEEEFVDTKTEEIEEILTESIQIQELPAFPEEPL